jgi:3-phosphoshikimate 1-carboxyvinyltransferase
MSTDDANTPLSTASGPIDASVAVPGSKSISNRALICAALAKGWSSLSNVAPGDDTLRMLGCLRSIEVSLRSEDTTVHVEGCDGWIRGGTELDAGLAGTTSRFMTAVAALGAEPTTIVGGAALRKRPMGDLHSALRALGARVEPLDERDRLPVRLRRGDLHGGSIGLKGDVSSQFLSALMLIGPYLTGGLEIELTSTLISKPYVSMTARVMSAFGMSGVTIDEDRVFVPEGRYVGSTFEVEPDASSASYPLAAAAILGGDVNVQGLTRDSMQGDIRILDILEEMGCRVDVKPGKCSLSRSGAIRGVDIDMSDVSDLVPTIAAVALFASTPTRIRNVGFIRGKESDRIGDLVAGIETMGGRAVEYPDGLEVLPFESLPVHPIIMNTHHDHRLAMAWSLVAFKRPSITIDVPSVVDKSWPQWWSVREAIRRTGIN